MKRSLPILLIAFTFLAACTTAPTTPQTTVTLMPTTPATHPPATSTIEIPTNTPTPENLELTPTLPPSEHGEYILDLIASTEDCQLPCIFGITPGKTTYAEVRRLFHPVQPLEAIPVGGGDGWIYVSLYMSETSYENISIGMEEKNNLIEAILVVGHTFLQNDPYYIKEFAAALEKYSPENVLRIYGLPTRVYMNLQEPAAGDVIDLLMFYDDLGFFFHYVFSNGIDRDEQSGFLNVCPEYKYLDLLRFYSQSTKNMNALEKLAPTTERLLNTLYFPLEDLTEFSLGDFHRIIVEKENNGCFVSP